MPKVSTLSVVKDLQLLTGTSPVRNTRTIAFNYTTVSVLSWRADADYDIISVFGYGASNLAIVNFGGGTYASLAAAGLHLDWVSFSGTSTTWIGNQPILFGQLLYCSIGSTSGATEVVLALK